MTSAAGGAAGIGPGWRVRALEPRDAEALARLAAELNAHQGDPTDNFTPAAVLRDGFGDAPRFVGLVVEQHGELVGYALLLPAYETGWAASGYYLTDVHVTERARGRGIGRALVAAAAARARRDGLTYLWWASRSWNERAHAFYRRLGASDEVVHAHALIDASFEALADDGERVLERDATDGPR